MKTPLQPIKNDKGVCPETRLCDWCGEPYKPDARNYYRYPWGLCCSKSCAAKKREAVKRDMKRA
ncbi:MAG: hypothetical protein LBS54_04265 [Dysgonamonadaceae bacterium]|nr:hypothetical protein [Dysgonamonadaceae bacterium]